MADSPHSASLSGLSAGTTYLSKGLGTLKSGMGGSGSRAELDVSAPLAESAMRVLLRCGPCKNDEACANGEMEKSDAAPRAACCRLNTPPAREN